jgi:uncharacterized alpha-E superfamily protein
MSRYLERADHLARAVDVTFQLDLDLHGVLANPVELEWNSLLSLLRQPPPQLRDGEHPVGAVQRWLLLDMTNPGSVMSCVNRSRNNARSIRGSISPPMWRELNKLYWRLSDSGLPARVAESPHDFCEETQIGVLLFHGVCQATLMHDEGWHFIQLGRHLERAEKVLRILDSKFGLLERSDTADLPINNLQWGAVLKNCAAYEAYQRLYISRVEPERVVEFLLANPDFPHSVRFCLSRIMQSLTEISGRLPDRCDDEVVRTVGRLLSDLVYLDGDALDGERLHSFLGDALIRCARIGSLLQQQYALQ